MARSLGEKIKAARQDAGLTQKALADKMQIGNTRLSNWEKDVSRPNTEQLESLCWALGVQPNYFFDSTPSSPMIQPDDFTYAMHGASGDLTDRDKQILMDMANQLASANRERKKVGNGENTD